MIIIWICKLKVVWKCYGCIMQTRERENVAAWSKIFQYLHKRWHIKKHDDKPKLQLLKIQKIQQKENECINY